MDPNFGLGKLIGLDTASEAIDLSGFPLEEGQQYEEFSACDLVELKGLLHLGTESNAVEEPISFEQKDVLHVACCNVFDGSTTSETGEHSQSYTEPQLAEEQVACYSTDSASQQWIGSYERTYNEELGARSCTREPYVKVNESDNEENAVSYTEDPYVKITIVNDREVEVEV